jgi:hypothetical protein
MDAKRLRRARDLAEVRRSTGLGSQRDRPPKQLATTGEGRQELEAGSENAHDRHTNVCSYMRRETSRDSTRLFAIL